MGNSVIAGRTKEEVIARAHAIIGGYKDLTAIWEAIRDVAKQMDGKVLNKRFADKVNAQIAGIGSISLQKDFWGKYEISLYINNRWVKGVGYFDGELYCTKFYDFHNRCLTDGRIDADKVEAEVIGYIDQITEYSERWRDAAEHYDAYDEALSRAKLAFSQALGRLNKLFIPSKIMINSDGKVV